MQMMLHVHICLAIQIQHAMAPYRCGVAETAKAESNEDSRAVSKSKQAYDDSDDYCQD